MLMELKDDVKHVGEFFSEIKEHVNNTSLLFLRNNTYFEEIHVVDVVEPYLHGLYQFTESEMDVFKN